MKASPSDTDTDTGDSSPRSVTTKASTSDTDTDTGESSPRSVTTKAITDTEADTIGDDVDLEQANTSGVIEEQTDPLAFSGDIEDDDLAGKAQDFGGKCPAVKVAGYKLVLRGFWSPSTPLAIHSSLAQCAELCSGHPNCLRFSFQKSGVCSVYSRLDGAPTLTDACSYGFDQGEDDEVTTTASPQAKGKAITVTTARREYCGPHAKRKRADAEATRKNLCNMLAELDKLRGARKRKVHPPGAGVRSIVKKVVIAEPTLGSDEVQEEDVAKAQALAWRKPDTAEILPDPSKWGTGYEAEAAGERGLRQKDPRTRSSRSDSGYEAEAAGERGLRQKDPRTRSSRSEEPETEETLTVSSHEAGAGSQSDAEDLRALLAEVGAKLEEQSRTTPSSRQQRR
ncbi:unnamed protein product [Effrenium voratum]|nr:unnamed protein product [Effrenium voratum]